MSNNYAIFAGSWNPLHQHHLDIANHVEEKYRKDVIFEICTKPFDKEPLSQDEVQKRVNQFEILGRSLLVTDNTSYMQRARYDYGYGHFDKREFIVGFDTILRIDDAKYYFGSESEKKRILSKISKNCRFLVFNRGESDKSKLSQQILEICDFSDFRTNNISSTQIRNGATEKSKFTNLVMNKENRCFVENIIYGTCFIYNGNLYKLVDTSPKFNRKNGTIFTDIVAFNGEEFVSFSWGTEVYKTDIKAWEHIK